MVFPPHLLYEYFIFITSVTSHASARVPTLPIDLGQDILLIQARILLITGPVNHSNDALRP
jgi:hypothetical protein